MQCIDWLIVAIPLVILLAITLYSKRYVRGVVDYLAAGRVAGRYVLTVGDMTAGLGIITLVASVEAAYHTGFAMSFWNYATVPVYVIISLSGYCVYRFRESKALSNGQFLEMRYSRSFRIFASFLRIMSEMLTNAIGPAVAANFFIYFLGLPHKIMILGVNVPTFSLVVGIVLLLALIFILPGGRISLVITDCIQGLFCYPMFVIISAYIMIKFSWGEEVVPTLSDRVHSESFMNPFDVSKLRDFNLFALFATLIGNIYNRASFAGNDITCSARTPHEQKMASILCTWRTGFSMLMTIMLAIAIITVMNHSNYAPQAHKIRQDLSHKVAAEVFTDPAQQANVAAKIDKIQPLSHIPGSDAKMTQSENMETVYMNAVQNEAGDSADGNLLFQKFRSLYNQMMMPMGLRSMLPVGLFGMFCLLAILLMVTTDDSRIFNASAAIIQDLVLPLKKAPMSPQQHMRYVKLCSVFVAVFFFCGSLLFSQLDYINMFLLIMVSIWMGGAGPVMVLGLYSRFGNTVGAYCSIIFGSGTAIAGVLLQRNWADYVYPFMKAHGWVQPVGDFLAAVSKPFNPYIVWTMDPVKCPINSYEFYFIALMGGTIGYIGGSLLTYRGPYNLERLLHRGQYNTDGVVNTQSAWTWKSVWGKLIGITPDYTRGDRIIVWSIFGYTFGYQVGLCFLLVLVWNAFQPWPNSWWSAYYFINYFVIAPFLGIITTVWFMYGGIVDIRRLFRDLEKRVDNPLDDGRVEGHVSVVDIAALGKDNGE